MLIKIYCINTSKNSLLKELEKYVCVKNVFLIQFCYIHYISKLVKETDYILIYCTNGYVYITGIEKGCMVKDCVACDDEIKYLKKDIFTEFQIHTITKIYGINIEAGIMRFLEGDFEFEYIGDIDEEKIIREYNGVLI